MSHYKVTEGDLADLVRKIYEEACYGYMDLKESVCDRMLRDFLSDRPKETDPQPPADWGITQGGITIGPNPEQGFYINSTTGSYILNDNDPIQIRSSEDNSVVLRDTDGVRFDYNENESERF